MTQSTRTPYPVFFSYLGYFIFSMFLAVVILEIGSALVRSVYHRIHSRNDASLASSSPAYQGYPWAQAFWKEEHLRRNTFDRLITFPF